MIVVDSVGWIAYFAGHPLRARYREHLSRPESIGTPTIVLYEVYRYLAREVDEEAALKVVYVMEQTSVIPLTDELAISAAELGARYKLPMADAIIYATAQDFKAILVTSDSHFESLPGVDYIARDSASG